MGAERSTDMDIVGVANRSAVQTAAMCHVNTPPDSRATAPTPSQPGQTRTEGNIGAASEHLGLDSLLKAGTQLVQQSGQDTEDDTFSAPDTGQVHSMCFIYACAVQYDARANIYRSEYLGARKKTKSCEGW